MATIHRVPRAARIAGKKITSLVPRPAGLKRHKVKEYYIYISGERETREGQNGKVWGRELSILLSNEHRNLYSICIYFPLQFSLRYDRKGGTAKRARQSVSSVEPPLPHRPLIIYLVCIFESRNVYLKAIRALPGRIIARRSIGSMRNYRPEIAARRDVFENRGGARGNVLRIASAQSQSSACPSSARLLLFIPAVITARSRQLANWRTAATGAMRCRTSGLSFTREADEIASWIPRSAVSPRFFFSRYSAGG